MTMIDREISFFVDGIPAPQPRPKAAIIAGHVHIYTPKTADKWKRAVMEAARNAADNAPAWSKKGRMTLYIEFILPRPKSHFGTGRNAGVVKPAYVNECPTTKPDIDNLVKSTMDALSNAGCIWNDDAQVCLLAVCKSYQFDCFCLPRANISILKKPKNER